MIESFMRIPAVRLGERTAIFGQFVSLHGMMPFASWSGSLRHPFSRVLLVLLLPFQLVHAQLPPLSGQLRDQETHAPLGFASVSVLRQPYGTVADAQGRFTLNLPPSYDADSVRLSLVGYAPRTWRVSDLRRLTAAGPLALRARAVPLAEARVRATGLKQRVLGNSTLRSTMRIDGFAANSAGNQIGQRIVIKRPAFLEEVSLGIRVCTYDSVAFRLNVYQLRGDYPAENLLPAPIYFQVSREQMRSRVYVNLRRYRLYLTQDVVVAVELVRSLGKGELWFSQPLAGGGPFYKVEQTPGPGTALNVAPKNSTNTIDMKRHQPDGPWTKYPNLGVGIDATVLELPN